MLAWPVILAATIQRGLRRVMPQERDGLLAGKAAFITGASRRIGRATALGLAREGADLLLNARSARDEVEGVAAEVRALGRRAAVVMGDVTDEAEVGRMAGEAAAAFGRIDILVNNAAIRRQVPFTEMSYGEWREIMAVILRSAEHTSELQSLMRTSYAVFCLK